MQVALIKYSSKLLGEKLWKIQVFLSGIDGSKRARISESQIKATFVTFFDVKGSTGQTVDQAYCMEILKHLHEAVRRKSLNFGPTIGFSRQ
jgi:hypothetical protein